MGTDIGILALWGVLGLSLFVIYLAATAWWRGRAVASSSNGSSSAKKTVGSIAQGRHKSADKGLAKIGGIIINTGASRSAWGFWPWALISTVVLGALGWLIWNSSMDLNAGSVKWILWSLMALAGLFSFLGIAQMTRHHPMIDEKRGSPRGLGFITLISGLVLGLASWFVWQPKISGMSGSEERHAVLSSENEGLSSRLISRDTLIQRLRSDIEKSATKYTSLDTSAKSDRKNSVSESERLNGLVTELIKNHSDISAENTRLKSS